MARLFIGVVVVAIGSALVWAAANGTRAVIENRRRRTGGIAAKGDLMKQTSFVLLVALIFYAAIWGAG